MADVTRLLDAAAAGDPRPRPSCCPLVYDELRQLAGPEAGPGEAGPDARGHRPGPRGVPAAGRRRGDPSAGTAAATSSPPPPRRCAASWSRTPAARGARSTAAGGGASTRTSTPSAPADPDEDLLALHEALEQFAAHDPLKAKLVELRFFGGLTLEQAAECLDISLSTADRAWRYARAWLYAAMAGDDPQEK